MNWYLTVVKKYAVFEGRARRKEFWMFTFWNLLFLFTLHFIENFYGLDAGSLLGGGLLSTIYALAMIIPGIAVIIRRLHDTGRSGWWYLVAFIPLIGPLVLLFFLCQDSQPGWNQYGDHPIIASPDI